MPSGDFPWEYAGPLNDGLPLNYGITDKFGVVIARFDSSGYAGDVVRLINAAAERFKQYE